MTRIRLKRLRAAIVGLASAALLGTGGLASASPPVRGVAHSIRPAPSRRPSARTSANGSFRLVTIGDLLFSHPFADSPDPKLQKVFRLLRSGDVVIGNKEGIFFDLKVFEGSGRDGGLLWGEAALGRDMKAMGVDMVSIANNHSMDWGWRGLKDCLHLLDDAGIAYAGAGRNLQAARRAGYLRTPKGTVALIATTSTFTPNAGANDAFGDVPGRPGISILRLRKINLVTESQMALIRRLARARASRYEPAPPVGAREVRWGDELYRVSSRPGLQYQMNRYDLAGLLRAVRAARRRARFVVFAIHAHETASGEDDDNPQPPDFLVKLAHAVIDAGADVFLGTGIHDLRGIEIYKGRPVFYGMSSFFINGDIKVMQQSALQAYGRRPSPRRSHPARQVPGKPGKPGCYQVRLGGNPRTWYDSMVAVTDFDRRRVNTVRLYPLDLGDTCNRARRGIPHLAGLADAQRILAELQSYSAPFGTRIAVHGSVGVIHIR
jgi:hypothetical protein